MVEEDRLHKYLLQVEQNTDKCIRCGRENYDLNEDGVCPDCEELEENSE